MEGAIVDGQDCDAVESDCVAPQRMAASAVKWRLDVMNLLERMVQRLDATRGLETAVASCQNCKL
jgi:hypothetical protein